MLFLRYNHKMLKEAPNSPDEISLYTCHLHTIADTLAKDAIEYSLVGGLAIKATLEKPGVPKRDNGTLIDFDAVAFGPDAQRIQTSLATLKIQRCQREVFPELGIEPIELSDTPLPHKNTMMLSSMRRNSNGEYFLVYRDIEVKIPSETMKLHMRSVNGVDFPCFCAKTLLFRYLIRGGIAKEKDLDKLTELESYIICHPSENPKDELYAPYLDFVERIREAYPRTIRVYDAYWSIDHAMGDRISGSSGFLYGLIKHFRG